MTTIFRWPFTRIPIEQHRDTVIELVMMTGTRKFAEIGVSRGLFAQEVLAACEDQLEEYHMVDPWLLHTPRALAADIATQREWQRGEEAKYEETYRRVSPFKAARVIRLWSVKAATLFAPGSLDMVFIDGDHFYDAVVADIEAWWPVVKMGGYLTGHDYGGGQPEWVGVDKAVDSFFREDEFCVLPPSVFVVEKRKEELCRVSQSL